MKDEMTIVVMTILGHYGFHYAMKDGAIWIDTNQDVLRDDPNPEDDWEDEFGPDEHYIFLNATGMRCRHSNRRAEKQGLVWFWENEYSSKSPEKFSKHLLTVYKSCRLVPLTDKELEAIWEEACETVEHRETEIKPV